MLIRPRDCEGAEQKSLGYSSRSVSCGLPGFPSRLSICLQVIGWTQKKSSDSFLSPYISQVCNTINDFERAASLHLPFLLLFFIVLCAARTLLVFFIPSHIQLIGHRAPRSKHFHILCWLPFTFGKTAYLFVVSSLSCYINSLQIGSKAHKNSEVF